MNRRSFITAACVLVLPPPAYAATPPWSARLLQGGFDGTHYWAGLAISLAPKWKTYWRVPGDGGIAPQIEVTGENIKSFAVSYPAPQRYSDEAGVTIGYKDEVVFPIRLEPQEVARSLTLKIEAFFGVCEVVCIPAKFEAAVEFGPNINNSPDQLRIAEWLRKVPLQQSVGPVTKAIAKQSGENFRLVLDLSEAVEFVFVEGNPAHYFGNPTLMRGVAVFPVNGVKTLSDLQATPLRITVKPRFNPVQTLEQSLKVE